MNFKIQNNAVLLVKPGRVPQSLTCGWGGLTGSRSCLWLAKEMTKRTWTQQLLWTVSASAPIATDCYCGVIFDMLEIQNHTRQWIYMSNGICMVFGSPKWSQWWNWVQSKTGLTTSSCNNCGIGWSAAPRALSCMPSWTARILKLRQDVKPAEAKLRRAYNGTFFGSLVDNNLRNSSWWWRPHRLTSHEVPLWPHADLPPWLIAKDLFSMESVFRVHLVKPIFHTEVKLK